MELLVSLQSLGQVYMATGESQHIGWTSRSPNPLPVLIYITVGWKCIQRYVSKELCFSRRSAVIECFSLEGNMSTSEHARPFKRKPQSHKRYRWRCKNSSICHGVLACYLHVSSVTCNSNQNLMRTMDPNVCLLQDEAGGNLCVCYCQQKPWKDQNQQSINLSLSIFQPPQAVCGTQPQTHLFLLKT